MMGEQRSAKRLTKRLLSDLDLDRFRLEVDGRKWRAVAQQRSDLLLRLSGYGNADGTSICVSVPTLVRKTKWSEKTIDRRLRELEQLGLLCNVGRFVPLQPRLRRIDLERARAMLAAEAPAPSPSPEPTPVAMQLAAELLQSIIANNRQFKRPDLRRWASELDAMLREDSRDPRLVVLHRRQQSPARLRRPRKHQRSQRQRRASLSRCRTCDRMCR